MVGCLTNLTSSPRFLPTNHIFFLLPTTTKLLSLTSIAHLEQAFGFLNRSSFYPFFLLHQAFRSTIVFRSVAAILSNISGYPQVSYHADNVFYFFFSKYIDACVMISSLYFHATTVHTHHPLPNCSPPVALQLKTICSSSILTHLITSSR